MDGLTEDAEPQKTRNERLWYQNSKNIINHLIWHILFTIIIAIVIIIIIIIIIIIVIISSSSSRSIVTSDGFVTASYNNHNRRYRYMECI